MFTSANGVHALLRRLDALGRDLRDLGTVNLAAIGPKTADVLREYHLRADVVPATFSSEGLVAALAPHVDRTPEQLRTLLGPTPVTSDQDLVRLAHDLDRLEKEIDR